MIMWWCSYRPPGYFSALAKLNVRFFVDGRAFGDIKALLLNLAITAQVCAYLA
jgi:hypothetical protein|tara:strand:- start:627 stop:785 length:159 start_codon:yes stop_codon:yes gene_type:complete